MIGITVLTKNSALTLRKTLDSLLAFPKIVLLDSGSTDPTFEIAQKYPNVEIHSSPFLGFGPMHNRAAKLCKTDWILSIDSDEVLSPQLVLELEALSLDADAVYLIERHNYFQGKWIKGCSGWYPDWIPRLYNQTKTQFTEDLVHERIETAHLRKIFLKGPIYHTPYLEISDLLEKMQRYSSLFAKQSNKKSSLAIALIHSFWGFWKSYLIKGGILCGKEGVIISMYQSHIAFYKYLKLIEKNNFVD